MKFSMCFSTLLFIWINAVHHAVSYECRNWTYGHGCKSTCGHCANNTVCDHINGSCPNGKCAPGWKNTQDWKCDKECRIGTYGNESKIRCGKCAKKTMCDHVTGICPYRKCAPGWENSQDWKCDKGLG
ncbi:multiple epidermal growth factor-like domains protein 10 [Saccostrea cucullata]|uniref:multiple epidermal growth factor-like domains protein 10 n=1 Tax=Saccostrea cuccullata TaxID=36930 RepID=UPI002ED43FD2